MATEAKRLLKGIGWLPEVLRRHDLAARDGAEGQGAPESVSDAGQTEDDDLPAFLIADCPADDVPASTPKMSSTLVIPILARNRSGLAAMVITVSEDTLNIRP